jgi:hypothetical protein
VINDMSVYLPNMLGVVLALVQLSLFGIYGFASNAASKLSDDKGTLPYSVLKLED